MSRHYWGGLRKHLDMGRNLKVGIAENAEGGATRRSVYSILNNPKIRAHVNTFLN